MVDCHFYARSDYGFSKTEDKLLAYCDLPLLTFEKPKDFYKWSKVDASPIIIVCSHSATEFFECYTPRAIH